MGFEPLACGLAVVVWIIVQESNSILLERKITNWQADILFPDFLLQREQNERVHYGKWPTLAFSSKLSHTIFVQSLSLSFFQSARPTLAEAGDACRASDCPDDFLWHFCSNCCRPDTQVHHCSTFSLWIKTKALCVTLFPSPEWQRWLYLLFLIIFRWCTAVRDGLHF